MACKHEPAARRQSHSESRQIIVACCMRVDYPNIVDSYEFREAGEVLRVISPAQLERAFFRKKRQLRPQWRARDRCSVNFVPEIDEGARKIRKVPFAAAEPRHGAYLQNFHSADCTEVMEIFPR